MYLWQQQRQREKAGMYDKPSFSEEEMERILKKWAFEDVIREKMSKGE